MSGLEVVGVVLGGIPLLISGLDHYAEAASTIKRMLTAAAHFRNLSRELRTEHQIFRDAIDRLLGDCVDHDELQVMLNNIGGDAWSRPDIDMVLQRKLCDSYGVYMETVQHINQTLCAFRQRLEIGDDGKGPFTAADATAMEKLWKHFKFGLKTTEYSKLVDKIATDVSRLTKLTDGNLTLGPIRASRRAKVPEFDKIRQYASSVYSTLQTSLQGSCQASHRGSLYMQPLETKHMPLSQAEEQALRVVFEHTLTTPSQLPSAWLAEEAEIRLLETVVPSGMSGPSNPNLSPASKGKKQVRWPDPPIPATVQRSPSLTHSQQGLNEITDLCESIQKSRMLQCGMCFGYVHDQTTTRRHAFYRPEYPLIPRSTAESESLASLLDSNARRGRSLTVADRRWLALALSHGVLRLHDTPWLASHWGLRDIILFIQNDNLLAKYPFISADFHGTIQHSVGKTCLAIANETLFGLGVVLIELCMGQSLDSMVLSGERNADGTKHILTDFAAATRLIDQVYKEAGVRYGDVVRRCIRCDFDKRQKTLHDEAFRRAVYENVVAVLEEDARQFLGL